jgi:pimeloyl-ACP methyl ester carboxylesterase
MTVIGATIWRGVSVLAFTTVLAALFVFTDSAHAASTQGTAKMTGKYADVNGLKMYYEVHGQGEPIVVLHGGFMNIPSMGPLLGALAQSRQVIAVELEGHGRTADLDRPLSYEQMAADVGGLIRKLGLKQADVLGFSMGGATALRLAIDHPDLVRRLIVISAGYNKESFYPSIVAQWPGMSPDGFKGTPMEQAYQQLAPDPKHWPLFVAKMKALMLSFKGWPESDVKAVKAPTLLVIADADLIRPEHTLEMFHLLGGALPHGGMGPLPKSQLAVLPGTTHFNIVDRLDLLMPAVASFLDPKAAPAPTSPADMR